MTFGSTELLRGFDFLIAVIGLFGISEILLTMEEGLRFRAARTPRSTSRWCSRPGWSCRATG
jgi:TctA family transporter